MKTRSGLSLFFALTIAAFAVLSCSDRSPVSPGSNGLFTLDLRLSKMSEQAIDSVLVTAEHASMDAVEGKLTVIGKTATGSLEVFPGKWLVIVEAYTGSTLCYEGQIGPVDVVAGKSTNITSIELHATRDLVAEEVYIRWSETKDRVVPKDLVAGCVVDLVLRCRNAGSADAAGWRFEAYLDEVLLCSLNDVTILAGKEWLLWCPNWIATEGTHTVKLRLDTGDVIGEEDETNNTASLTFTVSAPENLADLKVQRIYISERDNPDRELTEIWGGDEVDFLLEYENAGSADASEWRGEVYIDGVLDGWLDDASIVAMNTRYIRHQWTAVAGTHKVEFRLDTDDVVKESDETNNILSLTFTVQLSGSIIAGQSVDGVDLGFTKTQVRGILGPPDEIDEDGNFMYDSGIMIIFDGDLVIMMMVFHPHSGITERGIELGATASQIEGKYGTDYTVEDIGAFTYFYWSLGIAFVFNESNICYSIAIFPSAEPPEARGIIAGQSVDGVEVGFTMTQVRGMLGPPDEIDEDGDYWYDSGIVIIFDGDLVMMMMVIPPYSGTTERGIELGATASQIEGKYGTDYTVEDIDEFAYFYWSLGIAFVFDESNICCLISIFSPSAAKAALMHTDTRKRLQKCVSHVALGTKPIHTDYVEQLHKISRKISRGF